MANFLASILKKIASWLETPSPQGGGIELEKEESFSLLAPTAMEDVQEINCIGSVLFPDVEENLKKVKKKKTEIVSSVQKYPIRDAMNLMDTPFLALSKNRKKPIAYESPDGTRKTRISAHSECFLASVYDWDIILFVAGRIQDILNKRSDIPPRSIIIPRHEILKALHKHNVNTQQKELEKSLHRLKRTAIDTTICNEDGRYKSDFGFIDSWEYTEREDKKEMRITLSQWLYDLICAKGALLKIDPAYFDITSGLKKFLYRTARKCLGTNKDDWEFSLKVLHEKSGSEREFKKFKSDLKRAVEDDDLPGYSMEWIEKIGEPFVLFKKYKFSEIEDPIEDIEETKETEGLSVGLSMN